MSRTPADWIALDKKHVWHPFTQMREWCAPASEPLVLVRGQGALLEDSAGKTYLDGNSSIWTNIHGHNHPSLNAAIERQLREVAHVSFLGTTNPRAIELAERLAGLFPPETLTRVFYSDDGSTAVEVALKMALQFWQQTGRPEKRRFAAFDGAYHGDTAGASSLGAISAFHDRFADLHFPVQRVRSIEELESLPGEVIDSLAAVILEPLIQGVARMRLWPRGMLSALRRWCDRHEVLMILDEVMTGFGRTGTMFACEQEGVLPDFLALAKGLTGGYLPLAATLTTEQVFDAFLGEYHELKTFFYGHSYCGNPLGCAAAIASLDLFEAEQTLQYLPGKIETLRAELEGIAQQPGVLGTRQCGLIAGIDLGLPDGSEADWTMRLGQQVCDAARAHGLLTRPILDTVTFLPPLCISEAQVSLAFAALRSAVDEVITGLESGPR